MPRDYKNSTQRKTKKLTLDWWDGLLVLSFVVVGTLFGVYFLAPDVPETSNKLEDVLSINTLSDLQSANLDEPELEIKKKITHNIMQNIAAKAQAKISTKVKTPVKQDKKPNAPRFDFYTILPSLEVIIPEHEIKARIREERMGKNTKTGKYILQAGSFRDAEEANRLKNRLVELGVASRIEEAQVGDVVWNRIKIGPYSGMDSILTIKTRLKSNGIDVLVIEYKDT